MTHNDSNMFPHWAKSKKEAEVNASFYYCINSFVKPFLMKAM